MPACSRAAISPAVSAQQVRSYARRPVARRLALGLQLFGRAVAVVRAALRDQPLGHRAIAIEPLRLKVRARTGRRPSGPRPSRARASACRRECPRPSRPTSARVGVLDAQHERAAVPAGEQPVEERRAGAADVQVAGGRWREADANHLEHCKVRRCKCASGPSCSTPRPASC